MTSDEKKSVVLDAATERAGKKVLVCAAAFKLSQKCGISLKEIGEICEQNGIRICSCQLGCF